MSWRYNEPMATETTTTNHQHLLDTAALATQTVVKQAMRVRGLTLSQAVRLVADRTGSTADEVEALLDRASLLALRL